MSENNQIKVEEIIKAASEAGFELCNPSLLNGDECITMLLKNNFTVRGEHSYDRAYYYLVIDRSGRAYLCYKPSIAFNLPANDDYPQWLDKAADFAGEVAGLSTYIEPELRGDFGRRPLTVEIEEVGELENLEWFTRGVMCYQTVIEMMVEGHSTIKTFKDEVRN